MKKLITAAVLSALVFGFTVFPAHAQVQDTTVTTYAVGELQKQYYDALNQLIRLLMQRVEELQRQLSALQKQDTVTRTTDTQTHKSSNSSSINEPQISTPTYKVFCQLKCQITVDNAVAMCQRNEYRLDDDEPRITQDTVYRECVRKTYGDDGFVSNIEELPDPR